MLSRGVLVDPIEAREFGGIVGVRESDFGGIVLTDVAVRKAVARDRAYKLADAAGLYLFVAPSGSKAWRLKYRAGGKERVLGFGPYPEVTLAEARSRRDAARRQLRDGVDPAEDRRRRAAGAEVAAVNRFEDVARAWHKMNTARWDGDHAKAVLRSLERDVFPSLGRFAIDSITPPMVLKTLREVEARSAIETARRLRQRLSAIFVYGLSSGFNAGDPAAIVLGAMAPMPKNDRYPAIVEIEAARALLDEVESMPARAVTKLAMRLLALTAVRPGEIHAAGWSEFEDLDGVAPRWRIPADRMKPQDGVQMEFVVPLARQAVETIAAVRQLTGNCPMVFPNDRWAHRPMSENALSSLLKRAGYSRRHVPHGWRSTFSTIMNERAEREGRESDRAIIDLMLAHIPAGAIEPLYNRAAYMPRRREIAQTWADLLMPDMSDMPDMPTNELFAS